MAEIILAGAQLPDTAEALSKFVLVGREKLNAVRAEIRAIDKVGLAKEVHEQKLKEAQDIADAVLDAEVKIGELTAKIEKASGARTDLQPLDSAVERSKAEQLAEIGISQHTAERFERLAAHPELVQEAKEEARERGEIVTRQAVINKISAEKAAEKETRRQEEARKLREAKQRHDDYVEQKSEGVVSLNDVKQDKEDARALFVELQIDIIEAAKRVFYLGGKIESGEFKNLLTSGDHWELRDIYQKCEMMHSTTVRLMRNVAEVIENEKQSKRAIL